MVTVAYKGLRTEMYTKVYIGRMTKVYLWTTTHGRERTDVNGILHGH